MSQVTTVAGFWLCTTTQHKHPSQLHTQSRAREWWWKNKMSVKLAKRVARKSLFEFMPMGFMISFTSAMPVLLSKPKKCNFKTSTHLFLHVFFYSSLSASFFIWKEPVFMILSSTPCFFVFLGLVVSWTSTTLTLNLVKFFPNSKQGFHGFVGPAELVYWVSASYYSCCCLSELLHVVPIIWSFF